MLGSREVSIRVSYFHIQTNEFEKFICCLLCGYSDKRYYVSRIIPEYSPSRCLFEGFWRVSVLDWYYNIKDMAELC